MRRAAKLDSNHTEIVNALCAAGCSVLSLAALGYGAVDILVGHRRRNVLMEIKRPGVAGKKRGKRQQQTNDKQEKFRANWRGEICVVTSVDEALLVLGIVT